MPFPRSATIAATAALALCAGCVQQPSPSPLPQATPTYSCTPVTGGTPYPCYENQYQETSAQNALYEQAEAVYRKYSAENERIYRAGGATSPTSVLLATTTGDYQNAAMAEYRKMKKDGGRLLSGSLAIVWTKRVPALVTDGSVAAMELCKDISDATFLDSKGKTYQIGQDSQERAYFVDVDGQLKIARAQHQRVKTC